MGFLDSLHKSNIDYDPADQFDRTNINDGIYQARQAITEALSTENPFLQGTEFSAIALWVSQPTLTPPIFDRMTSAVPINRSTYAPLPKMVVKVYFRVPVMHSNLPLPNSFNSDSQRAISKLKPEEQNALLISCHPHLYADYESFSEITAGDQIKVRFDDKTYSSAKIIKLEEKATNNIVSPLISATEAVISSVVDLFDDASESKILNLLFEPTPPEEIKRLAEFYDKDEEIPRKDSNSKLINEAHPEMIPYIKAFIYKSWKDLGASIKVNSTYRSPTEQQELYDEWVAGGKIGVKPAQPGSSWHNVGAALDFNPTLSNGVTMLKKNSKQEWINSKIPELGESLGLRWGGHWTSNYDPIHFDLGSVFSSQQKKTLLETSKSTGVEPVQIPFA